MTLAPDFADSYLGQQGDVWDAQKDIGLAAVGAVISMFVVAIVQAVKPVERYSDPIFNCKDTEH